MNDTTRQMVSTATVLREAAALLVTRGWCRGSYRSKEGKHCAAGAILAAVNEGSHPAIELQNALEAVRRRLTSHHHSFVGGVLSWNDDPNRTQKEVVDVLLATAGDLEGAL